MNDVITKEHIFSHSIDTVWNAISKGEEISKWFLKADFKPKKGYQYLFTATGDDCSPIHGEVIEASPYTLIYTWIVTENPVETTVTWRLENVKEGTKLYLEHSGISGYKGETAVTMFNSFNGGWDHCISDLSAHLKKLMYAG